MTPYVLRLQAFQCIYVFEDQLEKNDHGSETETGTSDF